MSLRDCSNCHFFEPNMEECRRHPPTVNQRQFRWNFFELTFEEDRHEERSTFPSVSPSDWCGEHKLWDPVNDEFRDEENDGAELGADRVQEEGEVLREEGG